MNISLTIPLQLKTFNKATGYSICQFQQQKPGLPESLFNFVVPSLMHLSSYAKFIRPSIRPFTEQPAQQQTQTPIGPPTYPPILPQKNSLIILLCTRKSEFFVKPFTPFKILFLACIDSLIPFLSEVS